MRKFKKKLFKLFAPYLLRNQCPIRVFRVGGDAASQNCYYLYVYSKSEPILVTNKITSKGVTGTYFDGNDFCGDASIPYDWFDLHDIRIIHYFGTATFEYKGLFNYISTGFTKMDVVLCYLKRIFGYILQLFF